MDLKKGLQDVGEPRVEAVQNTGNSLSQIPVRVVHTGFLQSPFGRGSQAPLGVPWEEKLEELSEKHTERHEYCTYPQLSRTWKQCMFSSNARGHLGKY